MRIDRDLYDRMKRLGRKLIPPAKAPQVANHLIRSGLLDFELSADSNKPRTK